jgi:hypothetical protein
MPFCAGENTSGVRKFGLCKVRYNSSHHAKPTSDVALLSKMSHPSPATPEVKCETRPVFLLSQNSSASIK